MAAHLARHQEALAPKPSSWKDAQNGAWRGRKAGSYKWYEIQDNVAYWQSFEKPKIFVPEIQGSAQYALDYDSFYCVNKASFIVHEDIEYIIGILNSALSWWITQHTFASKQGGFFEFTQQYVSQIPIPKAPKSQQALIETLVLAIIGNRDDNRLEQLLNGLVYELFFQTDLHARGLTLFDEAERAGLGQLAGLEGVVLVKAAEEFSNRVFVSSHPLYAMLFDLQALEVVRIIEGKE
ncbi:TaqI-like C-terminal specificity domain-containing protein [Mesorhizobium sp. M0040]|uniref:TaqI-like C-terminal specificity domain-containing protein n=1 Tax=Mesorhizobium sp. M0040 TaxID=2956855 RepID=UPI00333BAA24